MQIHIAGISDIDRQELNKIPRSYAAAMSSPIMAENLANDPFIQRLRQPLPELSVTPEPQQMYPVPPTNFYGPPPLPAGRYPIQMPQPYYMQPQSPFTPVKSRQFTTPPGVQPVTPLYYQPSLPEQQQFFLPPIADNYPMQVHVNSIITNQLRYSHTFSPYRTAPPTPRQFTSPIYQQYYPSAPMSAGYNAEPGTDPRNPSPSGYITGGSTSSPTPVTF